MKKLKQNIKKNSSKVFKKELKNPHKPSTPVEVICQKSVHNFPSIWGNLSFHYKSTFLVIGRVGEIRIQLIHQALEVAEGTLLAMLVLILMRNPCVNKIKSFFGSALKAQKPTTLDEMASKGT